MTKTSLFLTIVINSIFLLFAHFGIFVGLADTGIFSSNIGWAVLMGVLLFSNYGIMKNNIFIIDMYATYLLCLATFLIGVNYYWEQTNQPDRFGGIWLLIVIGLLIAYSNHKNKNIRK